MSRATSASRKRMQAAQNNDWDEVERLEAEEAAAEAAKPKAVRGKRPKSLTIKVQEMEKYDWNPSMRFLLLILVIGTRRAKEVYSDTWVPENSPWTAEEMVGWCDMAQWRLAQRVGLSEGRINEMLAQLELDGFIRKEEWTDPDTGTIHCRYQVVEVTVDANQRKEHSRKAKRGPRYGKERKANKGSFSKSNQPKMTALQRAIREEDDENSPTVSQPLTQRFLTRKPTVSQPIPNGSSAVAQRHLSRGTQRYVSRDGTAEMPFKGGLTEGINPQVGFGRFDFAGSTSSGDTQASTRLRRVTSVGVDVRQAHQKQKTLKAKSLKAWSLIG